VFTLILDLLVGIFLGGAFVHLFLWMWGGTSQSEHGINQTIRWTGYAFGSFALVAWIPVLNILLGIVFTVFFGLGLARLHRTDPWRGVCAAFTPLFVLACCCVAGLALGVSLAGLAR
jgi:hypothetical protein